MIGHPIAHSKSPQMQTAALQSCGIEGRYIRVEAPLEQGGFAATLAALEAAGFTGCNVTVPFKTQAFAAAVQRDALSELCGASNTLVKKENGWHAYNTDGPGFSQAIRELCGDKLSNMKVVIIGACGGAGSALSLQCMLEGCDALTMINRPKSVLSYLCSTIYSHIQSTQRKIEISYNFLDGIDTDIFNNKSNTNKHILKISKKYKLDIRRISRKTYTQENTFQSCDGSPISEDDVREAVRGADLIVNATSLGLKEGDPMPIPAEWLTPAQAVYDIVTHDTPFRRAAQAAGCRTANGLSMLLWQGAYAFEHWFGVLPSVDAMRSALEQA